MYLFKLLKEDRVSSYEGYKYPEPGVWTPCVEPELDHAGYHLTNDPLSYWETGLELWLAEGKGKAESDHNNLVAFESARLIQKVTWNWQPLDLLPRVRLVLAATDRYFQPTCDLHGIRLGGANLSSARLGNSDLHSVDLPSSNFALARLHGANFNGASLRNVSFAGACLGKASFIGADCTGTMFSDAIVDNADFTDANLSQSCWPIGVPAPEGWEVDEEAGWLRSVAR